MSTIALDRDDSRWVVALVPPLAVRAYGDAPEAAVQRLLLLAVALGIAYAWAALFARSAGRSLGRGLPAFAVMFVVLLPGGVAWVSAVVALSFGAVFGREVFGGRVLLPPALVALTFAIFSFPGG
ncbi:MAG TPA: RnfABCDGE type electron transport complex subunit D, partial [Vicinamibacterales bacterium]|nr:RnfABCDGE type electron transport complex subunit D [Vicinamibacterales bacterium]